MKVKFAEDYARAQHSLEWTAIAGGAAFEIVLTVVLAAFTGGLGATSLFGSKARLLTPMKKLGGLFEELAILRRKVKLHGDRKKGGAPVKPSTLADYVTDEKVPEPSPPPKGDRNREQEQDVVPDNKPPAKPPTPKKMDRFDVDCFTPGDSVLKSPSFSGNKKKMEKEFYQQLKDQEEGINNLTVSEYLENRKKYDELGREGVSDGGAQRKAGNKLRKRLTEKFQKEIVDNGSATGKKAMELAKERAAKTMKSLAALHDPDMIAGGYDKITTEGRSGMGNTNVNSSIGSQWKTRVGSMDEAAEQAMKKYGPDTKMNVGLSRCKM